MTDAALVLRIMRKQEAACVVLLLVLLAGAWSSFDVRFTAPGAGEQQGDIGAEHMFKNFHAGGHAPMTTRCKLLFGATYARQFAPAPVPPPPGRQTCSAKSYSFEFSAEVYDKTGPRTWGDVAKLPCKYLNFGGDVNRHSLDSNYFNYVAIQGSSKTNGWGCTINKATKVEECGEWCVCADLRERIPLPDASVDRIHNEDFMEHIHHTGYPAMLKEIYRLLKPGAHARMAMPDYGNGAASSEAWQAANEGKDFPDPGSTAHRTLTNYALLKKYIAESPFKQAEWLQYGDNTDKRSSEALSHSSSHLPEGAYVGARKFVNLGIDHQLGVVRRTPGVDCRNNILRGSHSVTSLVFDLVKPIPA